MAATQPHTPLQIDPNPRLISPHAQVIMASNIRALFGEKYPPVTTKKMMSLPPSLPSTPFQIDFTMVFATLKHNIFTNNIKFTVHHLICCP